MVTEVTMPPTENSETETTSPPRAFTQGVGLVFQWLGVVMFLAFMFVCCSSGLLSKDVATHSSLLSGASKLEACCAFRPAYTGSGDPVYGTLGTLFLPAATNH